MVLFNYSTRELTAKIVYYGPGLCGKTTNLQYIFDNLSSTVKGKMLSLATKTDRTLFFDFLPLDLGEIRGMKTRIQLYTVPGQVFYNETRRLVLKGADGVVFVADSQKPMIDANVDSYRNLEENLRVHAMHLKDLPLVIQYNKRDVPNLATIDELNASVNKFNSPFYESVATTGLGVQDTLKAITKLVLLHLTKRYDTKKMSTEQVSTSVSASAAVSAAASSGGDFEELEMVEEAALDDVESTVRMSASGAASGADVADEDEVVELTEEYEEPEAVEVSAEDDEEPIELDDVVEEPPIAASAGQSRQFDIEEIEEIEDEPIAMGAPISKGAPPVEVAVRKKAPAAALEQGERALVPHIVLGQERLITIPVDIEANGTVSRYELSIALRITKPSRGK